MTLSSELPAAIFPCGIGAVNTGSAAWRRGTRIADTMGTGGSGRSGVPRYAQPHAAREISLTLRATAASIATASVRIEPQAELAAPPQDVVGAAGIFMADQPADLGIGEGGAVIAPEIFARARPHRAG